MASSFFQSKSDDIFAAMFFFVAMLVTAGIAYFKGYFKIGKSEALDIKVRDIISIFFIYFFTYFFLGYLVIIYLKNIGINFIFSNKIFLVLSFCINLLTLVFISFYCSVYKKRILYPLVNTNSSKLFFKNAIIGMASWLVVFPAISFITSISELLVYYFFNVTKLPNQTAIDFLNRSLSTHLYFVLAIIQIAIFAPIIEEIIFRGFLYNFIKKILNRNAAIILSSLAFGALHYSPYQKLANIYIVTSIAFFGVFLSLIYERQKSLISPIFLHFAFNSLSLLNLVFFKGDSV